MNKNLGFILDIDPLPNIQPNVQKMIVENTYVKIDVLKFRNDSQEYSFCMNDLTKVEEIDAGNHSVAKYLHVPSNKLSVIKFIPLIASNSEDVLDKLKERLKQEINIHKFASTSPYVVDLYGLCFLEEQALIAMECMGMSLAKLNFEVQKKLDSFPGWFYRT